MTGRQMDRQCDCISFVTLRNLSQNCLEVEDFSACFSKICFQLLRFKASDNSSCNRNADRLLIIALLLGKDHYNNIPML